MLKELSCAFVCMGGYVLYPRADFDIANAALQLDVT